MIIAKPITNLERIAEYLEYDANTGKFTWLKNRKGHTKAGMEAGANHGRGYIVIALDGAQYLAHRLAWAIYYGAIPENMQIDHINGNRSDNRISNLRLASHAENCRNSKVRKHSKSGIKGVKKRGNKWHVRISVNRKEKWIGSYDTAEEANFAHQKAANELFGPFAKK